MMSLFGISIPEVGRFGHEVRWTGWLWWVDGVCGKDRDLMKRVGHFVACPVGKPQLFAPLIPTVWLREEVPHRAHAYSIIDPVNRP